jgi:hypothetical protein
VSLIFNEDRDRGPIASSTGTRLRARTENSRALYAQHFSQFALS